MYTFTKASTVCAEPPRRVDARKLRTVSGLAPGYVRALTLCVALCVVLHSSPR